MPFQSQISAVPGTMIAAFAAEAYVNANAPTATNAVPNRMLVIFDFMAVL
jgi:hypothetical protein